MATLSPRAKKIIIFGAAIVLALVAVAAFRTRGGFSKNDD